MALELTVQESEKELLSVFPEARDFFEAIKESGKLNLVHIYDNGSSLCESFRFVYGKKVWAIRELEPYSEGGDWKEIGVALDRKEPAIYFNMRTIQTGISGSLAIENGFQLGKEKEYFEKLTDLFKKIFIENKDAYYFVYAEGRDFTLKI